MADEIFDSTEALEDFKALMRDPAARQAFVEVKHTQREKGVALRYEHILRAVAETPWAIRPAMLGVIVDILTFRAEGGRLTPDEISERISGARRTEQVQPRGVAVLPIHGVIVPKAGLMSEVSGATSMEGLREQFRMAMASPQVSGIVLHVDSPGGMVDGVPEMAAEIRAARGTKPIVAVADTEAASAAYWLASQADKIVVTRSSRIGSIGVFTAHEDQSEQDDKRGVKTTLVSAGKFKTEGNPFEPLSEEARAHMQTLVNQFYGMFVSDVAQGRGVSADTVRNGFGQGRVVGAEDAVGLNMADDVGTLEETVGGLLALAPGTAATLATGWGGGSVSAASSTHNADHVHGDPSVHTHVTASIVAAAEEEAVPALTEADNAAWDGSRAMDECSDPEEFRSICAGEHLVGEDSQRHHWALPHHYLGRHPTPNSAGVRNALAKLPTTRDLPNRSEAEEHLNVHMRQINPKASAAELEEEVAALRLAFAQGKDLSTVRPAGPVDPGEKATMRARLLSLSE